MIQWPRPREMVALYDKEQQESVKITLVVNLKLFRAIFYNLVGTFICDIHEVKHIL